MNDMAVSFETWSSIGTSDSDLRFEEAIWSATLIDQWRDLERRSPDATYFQCADWCTAWIDAARASGQNATPRIATIWRGPRLVLLWPLAVRRLSVFRILHSLGEPATQYSDVLIDRCEDREALLDIAWEAVRTWVGIDAIELRRVRDGTLLAKRLEPHQVESTRQSAPMLDFRHLAVSSAGGQRSSRTRHALRRHERQLGEHGPVAFELVEDPDDQLELLECAFALKRAWQREKSAVSAGYAHGASLGCLQRLTRKGDLLVACLRSGDKIAAVEIGAVRQRRYYSLVQTYEMRFSKHAPGRLLFWHLLERCPQLSIDVFDFLAPAHRHKLEWSNIEIGIADYLIPVSARGHLAVGYLGHIRPMLRTCYLGLPATLREHASKLLHKMH
jgi:CelD/BcsL family acetyltransferase involved in cellulose biosynthesis